MVTMTITNQQVKLLMKMLKKHSQQAASAKSGMDVKTARKYVNYNRLKAVASIYAWKADYHAKASII